MIYLKLFACFSTFAILTFSSLIYAFTFTLYTSFSLPHSLLFYIILPLIWKLNFLWWSKFARTKKTIRLYIWFKLVIFIFVFYILMGCLFNFDIDLNYFINDLTYFLFFLWDKFHGDSTFLSLCFYNLNFLLLLYLISIFICSLNILFLLYLFSIIFHVINLNILFLLYLFSIIICIIFFSKIGFVVFLNSLILSILF